MVKSIFCSVLLVWMSIPSFADADHYEIIQVMDDITVRLAVGFVEEMDVENSKVWRIDDSSKGICWTDGTTGAKTCNATEATVVGRKPYNGDDPNIKHTVWIIDTDGTRGYFTDTYCIKVFEPGKGEIRWGSTTLVEGRSSQINVKYPTISKGGRYYYTEFSSSAPDIVEISDDGVYTAKKAGKATLTVKQYVANKNYPDAGSYLLDMSTIEINVEKYIALESFSVVEDYVLVNRSNSGEGKLVRIEITESYTPENATVILTPQLLGHEEFSFNKVRELSTSKPGLKHIRYEFYNRKELNEEETLVFTTDNGLEDQIKLIVYDPVESITLDQTNVELPLGKEIQLGVTVLPENATYKNLTWTSADETIATVSDTGLVKALKKGNVRITVTSDVDEISAYCDLTVIQPVEAIYLSKSEINIKPGEFETLTAYVSPENADNKALKWKSGDEKVAKVENGTVMGISDGKTVVRAIAADGSGVSAECAVNVGASSEIEDVVTDETAYVKIFNLQGMLIYEGSFADAHLVPDYYIVVCDGKKVKVRIE